MLPLPLPSPPLPSPPLSPNPTTAAGISIKVVSPSLGPREGGTVLTITGAGFEPASGASCRFGGQGGGCTPATFMSSTMVTCSTPARSQGDAEVHVTLNEQEFSTPGAFRYVPPPWLASLSPPSGPEAGSTAVTVFGGAFEASPLATCVFAGSNSVPATFISSSMLACASPAFAGGSRSASVQVALNGQDISTDALVFRYDRPASVSSLEPSVGPSVGGTGVTVFGENFVDTPALRAVYTPILDLGGVASTGGGYQVSCICISASSLVCPAPAMVEGEYSLEVANNGADFSTGGSGVFLSSALPLVTALTPSVVASSGGTTVTVSGGNFADSATLVCRFGESSVVRAVWSTASVVMCESPPQAGGAQQGSSAVVEVSSNGFDYSSSGVAVTFSSTHWVLSVTPSIGPEVGGTMVNVTGINFNVGSGGACRFGSLVTDATMVSSTLVSCSSPAQSPGGVTLQVSGNGFEWTKQAVSFAYSAMPVIASLSPSTVSAGKGSTMLTVSGTAFQKGEVTCRVSDSNGTATFGGVATSTTEALCSLPGRPAGGTGVLELSFNGLDFTTSNKGFAYAAAVRLLSVVPTSGAASGGTLVTITALSPVGEVTACLFNSTSAPPVSVGTHSVTCRTPPASVGIAAVSLSAGSAPIEGAREFRFRQTEILESFEPSTGDASGGLALSVRGRSFAIGADVSCRFGGVDVVKALVLSSTLLSCETPPSVPGPATVRNRIPAVPSGINHPHTCPTVLRLCPILVEHACATQQSTHLGVFTR
jgi:hypothetical protein